MTEYQKPYHILWSGISDALAAIRAQNFGLAQELLQAQQQAEDAFIAWATGTKKRRLAEKQVSVFWVKD